MVIFNSYVSHYQRVYVHNRHLRKHSTYAHQEDLAALRLTLEEATKRELLVEDVSSKDPWCVVCDVWTGGKSK